MIDYSKQFCEHLLSATKRYDTATIFSDFIVCFACAISNAVDKTKFNDREELYMKTISKYSKEELALFPVLAADVVKALEKNTDQDFLGKIFMELNLADKKSNQYFTPYSICTLMSDIVNEKSIETIEQQGWITVNDCACGSGAMLIAEANNIHKYIVLQNKSLNWQNHVLFIAQDINFVVALMCYIQLSLIGAAGFVKVGNTLTDPIRQNDDQSKYWYTPMYFSPIWTTRRFLKERG